MSDNITEIREGLEKQLKDGFAGLQKKYDAASEQIEKGNQVSTDLKKQIDNATGEIQKVVDKVLKLEEKGIGLGNQPGQKKGFIDFIKGNDEYKSLMGREKSAAEIEIKKDELAAMQETKAVTSAGIVVPNYDPTIQPGIRQELRIRDPTVALAQRIKQQIALNTEQLQAEAKLTTSQRLRVQVEQELLDLGAKAAPERRAEINRLLKQLDATGELVDAKEKEARATEQLQRLQAQIRASEENRLRANTIDLLSYGRGGDAVEMLRRQLDIQREYEEGLKQIRDRGVANANRCGLSYTPPE